MRVRPLLLLTLLFLGLTAAFGSLSLAARGHPTAAVTMAAGGTSTAAGAAALLARGVPSG